MRFKIMKLIDPSVTNLNSLMLKQIMKIINNQIIYRCYSKRQMIQKKNKISAKKLSYSNKKIFMSI